MRCDSPPKSSDNILNDVWSIGEKIGSGSYGSIYIGKRIIDGKEIAIKQFRDNSVDDGISPSTLREIISLKKLNHKNIISILDVITNSESIYIVQELMQMDLHSFISKYKTNIPINIIKSILYQILSGIAYVHSKNFFHRDLKPQNILVNLPYSNWNCSCESEKDYPVVKITDFGFCRVFCNSNKKYSKETMTPLYRAPEVLLGEEEYTSKVDLWSIGCIFAELLLGHPFFNESVSEVDIVKKLFEFFEIDSKISNFSEICTKDMVVKKEKWVENFPKIDSEGIDLLSKLLTVDPTKRISAEDALKHGFFNATF